jgi:uncharacterized Zn finger protein
MASVAVSEFRLTPLRAAFDEDACARLAGTANHGRGVILALRASVEDLRIRAADASGTVDDGEIQEVALSVVDGAPITMCTCGVAGAMCAHSVAVALVATGVIDPDSEDPDSDDEAGAHDEGVELAGVDLSGLEAHLADAAVDGNGASTNLDAATAAGAHIDREVRDYLAGLPREELVDLVLALASDDDLLIAGLRHLADHWRQTGASTA